MPPSDRDLAITACEDAVTDALKNIASILLRDLATSATDAERAEAKQRFENGLKFYKDSRQVLRTLVENTFPGS
jgi:hypothetical protein